MGMDRENLMKVAWEWPLYITDNNEVTCYKEGCIEPEFLPWPRRQTFGDFATHLVKHIIDMHENRMAGIEFNK